MWPAERTLSEMLTSAREMAEFPGLINCCLSFIIFHLGSLQLQLRMQKPLRPAEQAWCQQRAHPEPEATEASLHLASGNAQLRGGLQGLISLRRSAALADKLPLSGRYMWKLETLKTHRVQLFCTTRCLQEKESLVSHPSIFKW